MRAQLLKYWNRVRTSFWFVPSLMAIGSFLLAYGTVAVDQNVRQDWLKHLGWAYTGGAEGASQVLGTIAGSMITIAGVVFSMTLVALSLSSSQFGPRLLRNFMSDKTNQIVLGTFIATFLYCLLVLRTIRHAEEGGFVPNLSVTLGVAFSLVSLGVLIYFIHHVSISIQADEIVARVGWELLEGIDRLFPEHIGRGGAKPSETSTSEELPASFETKARVIEAKGDGYLQFIDASSLLSAATAADLVLRIERRPGQYVYAGCPLVRAWPVDRIDDKFEQRIHTAFALGNQRTPDQDVEFTIEQLVEIAVRALSPGVNDPFTAIRCVDRLGSALSRLTRREMPSPYRCDEEHRLRVVAPAVTFADLLAVALHMIRQNARSSAAVTIRLLDTLAALAPCASRDDDRAALRLHAEMIIRGARDGLPEPEDVASAEERYEAVLAALDDPPCQPCE